MKLNFIFVLIFSNILCFDCGKEKAVSVAFDEIINVLMKLNRNLMVMNFAQENGIFDDLLLRKLKNKNGPQKAEKRQKITYEDPRFKNIYESSILFFDSVENLTTFNNNFLLKDLTPKSIKLFVFIESATFNEILSLRNESIQARNYRTQSVDFDIDMIDFLQFQYFVLEEKK